MRKIVIGLLVIVAVFIGGIAFILSNLDEFVREIVQSVGSEVTKTEVTLDGANIDPANGKAALNGLVVGNPEGFKTPYALSLGTVSVKMDPTTVVGDVIVINEIVIDSPKAMYEMNDNGSNVDAIQANIDAFVKELEALTGSGGDTSAGNDAVSQEAASGPKFIIENLYIRDASTAVNIALLGGESISTPDINIHLTDIGKEQGGVLPAEAAAEIMDAFFGDILNTVTSVVDFGALGKNLEENVGAVIENVEDQAKELEDQVKNIEDSLKSGGEGLDDAVKDVGNTLKGIFGNN